MNLATVGNLQLQLPVPTAAVTAIGYHSSNDGALALNPAGRQGNEGLLARLWRRIAGSGSNRRVVWFQLGGDNGTEVLDVGAAPGTDVYAPADGVVVSITPIEHEIGRPLAVAPGAEWIARQTLVALR